MLGINTSALKSIRFWAVLVLTNISIAAASGVIMDGSQVAQILGWAVAVLSGLGFRSWAPKELTEVSSGE